MDLVEFADLASLITAAVIASPMPFEDVIAAFEVASKVLTEFAEEGTERAQASGASLKLH